MNTYEIYSWGDGEKIAPFDVSSHILGYLIKKNSLEGTYKIIPNSNIFKSKFDSLPILVTKNEQIKGFIEIWNFIIENSNLEINKKINDDPKLKILHIAYMNNLVHNLNIITLYNFFVVNNNYENYTRPSFKNYLPWPTQYKPPLDFRKYAQEIALNEGIIDDDLIEIDSNLIEDNLEDDLQSLKKEEKNLRETPVINDMQKLQIEKQLNIISQKKFIISNMQCIKKLKEIILNFNEIENSLNDDIFRIIFYITIKCNLIDELPENFILTWLKSEQPNLLNDIFNMDISINIETASTLPLSTVIYDFISQIL